MAEREGFEPSVQLPVRRISSAVLSTTQPPLRRGRTARLAQGIDKAKRCARPVLKERDEAPISRS
jgi:hypothetical protein